MEWAVHSPSNKILEPSCGDGVIVESAIKKLVALGARKDELNDIILGIEIAPEEVAKARARISKLDVPSPEEIIHKGDFFEYCKSNLLGKIYYDSIIGNPPFIRYQDFPKEIKEVALELMKKNKVNSSGHTNSWVPFLVVSSFLLNDKGLLAMIVPEQLFQVKYAAESRRFLSEYYKKLTIITFKKLIFQNALQDIVILLGEKSNNRNEGIRVIELEDISQIIEYKKNMSKLVTDFANSEFKPLNHTSDKWVQYFLDVDEILLLRGLQKDYDLERCGNILEVDIGVVTGRNSYFLLNEKDIKERNLLHSTVEIIGNSSILNGIRFSTQDWLDSVKEEFKTYLFTPENLTYDNLSISAKKYIAYGEKIGASKGYKCNIRKEWYRVPSIWIPDAFVLRQIHEYPKIVLNETNATCTDTIHRVKILNKDGQKNVIAAFLNSMTFSFAEVFGRSYGGGVLTLEPSEVERLPIPLKGSENLDIEEIDCLIRENGIEDVLNMTDDILLKQGLGLNENKIRMLRSIWKKLQTRRINRRKK